MTPKAWSKNDEKQYKHIKKGYEQKGLSSETAEKRAAMTVNKQRRAEGRTKSQKGK